MYDDMLNPRQTVAPETIVRHYRITKTTFMDGIISKKSAARIEQK